VAGGDLPALSSEAEALWGAESNSMAKAKCISASWGCVGALFRKDAPPADIAAWSEYFRGCGGTALAAVDTNGLLTLPWPQRVDGHPLDFDVLLGTANVETAPVPPEDVARAWIVQGNEDYFFENVRAGIRTPDDEKIWRCMVVELDWLKRLGSRFSPTIEALRNEFPTRIAANVRYFAPEYWGAVDRFKNLYRSTYNLPPRVHAAVAGTSSHFNRAMLLREIASDMIPSLELDRAELEAKGHSRAEHSQKLTAVIESAITSLYSSLDCGRQVVTHVFKKCRGVSDSTRKTFQRAAKGELDPKIPTKIVQAFAEAPWYPKFCHLRDALTHGEPGSCHRDEKTGAVMYFHDAVRDRDKAYIPDIFAYLNEYTTHVNLFLGQIFSALVGTLKDVEVEQICGFFDGLVYMRRVLPSEAKDLHSGRCESHTWFDQPGKKRCPLTATCGAYQRRQKVTG
jgi:hypothetical protein